MQYKNNQCERFVEIIQNLSVKRSTIAEAMIFCINHSTAIEDVFSILVESLCNTNTKRTDKIARMYLLSDILSNCVKKNITIANVNCILNTVIDQLHLYSENINEAVKELFLTKIMRIMHQLDIIGLLNEDAVKKAELYFTKNYSTTDGNSSSDEPLDGAKLLKHSLKNNNDETVMTPAYLKQKQMATIPKEYFVPSKWDTLDPEEVEAQAISSSQLYYLDHVSDKTRKSKEYEVYDTYISKKRKSAKADVDDLLKYSSKKAKNKKSKK